MLRPIVYCKWVVLCFVWLLLADLAAAERFSVTPPSQPDKQIKLAVGDNGPVPFTLIRSAEGSTEGFNPVDVSVSTLRDERGNTVKVKLRDMDDESVTATAELTGLMAKRSIARLGLITEALTTPGPYSGELVLTRKGTVLDSFAVVLTRAPIKSPAGLAIEPKKIDLTHTQPLWGAAEGPSFTVQVRETTGEWPLTGLSARLLELKGPEGILEPQRDLTFTINGEAAPNLWSWPRAEATGKKIAPGGKALVRGTFHGLEPGEYTAKLRFDATNAQSSDKHELVVTAKIKDSYGWAVICLTIAVIFSFLGTKGLTTLRERAAFRERIAGLRSHLNRLPHTQRGEPTPMGLPEVWARAALRQAQELSHRWVLSGIAVIKERVDQAERVITLLDRVADLTERTRELTERAKRRFDRNLGRIMREEIGAGSLDDQQVRDIESKLTELETWFQRDALPGLFAADLEPDVQRLLDEIRLDELKPYQAAQTLARNLITDLQNTVLTGQPLDTYLEREDKYAMLLFVWRRRNRDELDELVTEYNKHGAMTSVFKLADKAAWQRLKASSFKFISPIPSSLSPFEAYMPIRFEIEPTDPNLTGSWLFKHGLRYEWQLFIEPKSRGLQSSTEASDSPTLEAVSREPRIVQFSPTAGTVTPKVILHFGDESCDVSGEAYQFRDSSDFRWRSAFEMAEFVALLMAWIVAVITGLKMFYFDSAVFGSAKDYVLLFLWGAGADQVKNYVQALQLYSSKPSPATGKAPNG